MPCTTPTISMIAVSCRERCPKSVLIASSMARRRAISAVLNLARSLRRAAREVLRREGGRRAEPAGARVGDETLRAALARAAASHLPEWADVLTPHVLRHFCASQLYQHGMDLIAIQQLLGHAWIATTMKYVHVTGTHIEDAWAAGQQRAATRLEGLRR
ncbi:tyrosine-type recombinase/integrase [Nonomuraea sp. NPDC049158]|uniref:tyrosine-type recombinase/integrase n=1 Tax=Nonomuraea sp. NPDC049158 TaxID=3155649 RepID=UPI0033E0A468